MPRSCKVLYIDGGGIRGVIPARILAGIEERTGKPIAKLFDLIIGTTTDGILALGLVRPKDEDPFTPSHAARDLVNLYRDRAAYIFPQDMRPDGTGHAGRLA